MSIVEDLKLPYQLAKKSLINLRELFLVEDEEGTDDEKKKTNVACAKFHHEWSDILLYGKKNYAVVAFREAAKSEYIGRCHTIHRLMFPSDAYRYIIYIYASQTIASKNLKEHVNEYLNNEHLSANLVKVIKFSEEAFEAIVKDENGKEISVRIEAYGKGAYIRGAKYKSKRPSVLIIDDCQGIKDMESDTILKKDMQWFLSDVYFLGQYTRIFMIGNNLGENCIIETVCRDADKLNFEVMRLPIMDEETMTSNWDAKFSVTDILKEKENFRAMGQLDVWLREKMCMAINPDTQIFRPEYFRPYNPKDIKLSDLKVYMTVDPAISKKNTACYTAIVVVGVNKENHWFILDIVFGNFDPSETVENILKTAAKYKPLRVGIEDAGFQMALKYPLQEKMPKYNVWFEIVPLKHRGVAKEVRISAVQPRYISGSIWHPSNNPSWLAEFESELLSFKPGIKTKVDLIDAFAYQEQIVIPQVTAWSVTDFDFDKLPTLGAL